MSVGQIIDGQHGSEAPVVDPRCRTTGSVPRVARIDRTTPSAGPTPSRSLGRAEKSSHRNTADVRLAPSVIISLDNHPVQNCWSDEARRVALRVYEGPVYHHPRMARPDTTLLCRESLALRRRRTDHDPRHRPVG